MTHSELIKRVAKKLDLKPAEAAILWQQTGQILMKALAAKEKVRIKNFGAFVIVKHKSRTVPDPREMSKRLVIFDLNLPKFRPSEELRRQVKNVRPLQHLAPEIEDLEDGELTSPTTPAEDLTDEPITAPIDAANAPDSTLAKQPPTAEPVKGDEQTVKATGKKKTTKAATNQLVAPIDIGYADLTDRTVDPAVLALVPFHLAQKYQLVPIEQKDDELIVAMSDPGDREAIELVSRQTGLTVKPELTTQAELQHVLDQYNSDGNLDDLVGDTEGEEGESSIVEEATEMAEKGGEDDGHNDAPAAKVVTSLLERAVREKASDVHIEPDEKRVQVRFRIDGLLQTVMELPKTLQPSVTSRLKILSNLKIDESRLPQDGRIRLRVGQKEVDFRLSTLPTVNGEKFVMRILDKSSGILSFKDLGLTGINLKRVEDNMTKAHGMILVTGPTGSGKTTTLYAVIGQLMNPAVNIVTLEDPVEYRIVGINQSQVNAAIGFDFASGLRSIVRQDPDIILIGEIRDLETATMAVHSALTGHVVLSTLHTNDASGAIPRLIDMGIEPFLITSSTNAVIAQRLVRRVCQHCKVKVKLPEEALGEVRKELALLKDQSANGRLIFYKGKGCNQCHSSGYSGRFGIFETLLVSENIKQLALKRVSASEITAAAIEEGMITLKQDGILKALAGETTLEEVWRVTKD